MNMFKNGLMLVLFLATSISINAVDAVATIAFTSVIATIFMHMIVGVVSLVFIIVISVRYTTLAV